MIFFFWLTVSDVCTMSSIEVIFSVSDNCTLFESDSEINFFNFLNLFFFINSESTVIFVKTVNLALVKIEAWMNLNYWSFWLVYVNHSLSSSDFENLTLECSVFIFIKRCYHILCFFFLNHCFSYSTSLQSFSLFFIVWRKSLAVQSVSFH